MAGEDVKLLQEKITGKWHSLKFIYHSCMWINTACLLPCSISLEQRKALLLENEKLNFLLENKLLHTLPSTYITITSILLYYVFNLRDTTEWRD